MSNFRSIKEHGKISAAALIPASWHTAISVSRLICTDTPQMSVAETGRTPSVRPLPRRNPTRHTRPRNICRPLRFHFVTFLMSWKRDTNRSRCPVTFAQSLPWPDRFLSPPETAIAVPSTAPPEPRAGRRFYAIPSGAAAPTRCHGPDPRDCSEVTDQRFCRTLSGYLQCHAFGPWLWGNATLKLRGAINAIGLETELSRLRRSIVRGAMR